MAEEAYALIKNNNVINTIIFDNPSEELLNHFKQEFDCDLIILGNEKSAIGGTYDGSKFWSPQPFPSWTKNEDLNEWEAPVPYPAFDEENPKYYVWNEETLNWEEITE